MTATPSTPPRDGTPGDGTPGDDRTAPVTVPAPRPDDEAGAPTPPAELSYEGGGRHRHAMQDATLLDMGRKIPQALTMTIRTAWQVDRRMVLAILTCQLLSGVATALALTAVARAMKALLEAPGVDQALAQTWPSAVLAAAATGVGSTAWIVADWATRRLNPKIASTLDLQLVDGHMGAELAAYDEEGFQEGSEAAEIGAARALNLADDAKTLTNGFVQLASAATVLTVLHPVLLFVLLVTVVPRGVGGIIAARIDYRVHAQTVADRTLRNMMRWWLTTASLADELRANTMRPYLLRWYEGMNRRVEGREVDAARPYLRITLTAAAVAGISQVGLWGTLYALTKTGTVTLAAAGGAIVASQTAQRALNSIVRYGAAMFHHALYLGDYREFLDRLRGLATDRGAARVDAPTEIRLEAAGYHYPGKDKPALHPIDLTLRRGQVVALLGENGAGKSTLVRLLTGLALPTTGRALWDGTDLEGTDAESVWRHVGLVPQDHGHWPMRARENITLGQPRTAGDADVWSAAEGVGMARHLRGLDHGLDSLLARSVWGGNELSGGQWQRLACARALYRRPPLLILDEPTSEMDARGEHRVFQQLRESAPEAITVVVTHRIENVRMADRIICLERGRIREQGTWEELMALPGGLLKELHALSVDR